MKKYSLLVLVLLLVFVAAGCGSQQSATTTNSQSGETQSAGLKPVDLDFATFSTGSSWYSYGAGISEALLKELPAGSRVNVLAHAGGVGNLNLVGDGGAQIGLGFNVTARWAYDGTQVYEKPYTNLRGIAGYMDNYYFGMIASKSSGITDLAEIKEKKLPVRLITVQVGGLGEVINRLVLAEYGITYDDIIAWGGSVEHADHNTVVEKFKDGQADLYMQTITAGHPTVTEMAVSTPLTFLSLPDDIIKRMCERYGFVPAVMPAGTFKGQEQDCKTLGLTTNLFCTADLDEELVYTITKAVIENIDMVKQSHAALERFTAEDAPKAEGLGIPLHPGAERYYREAGLLK